MLKSIISEILASRRRPTERTKSASEYLFCHQEIINTCKAVMSGYDPDKHFFIDPGENVQDYYERIMSVYDDTRSDPNVSDLPITKFHGFALAERSIAEWNSYTDLDEELEFVKMYVPIESYIQNKELLVTAYQLRAMLNDFKAYKEQEFVRLNPTNDPLKIQFDDNKSTITIAGVPYETDLDAKPIKFLRILVERINYPAGYQTVAGKITNKLSSNYLTHNGTKRFVQDIKNKNLKPKLKAIGIPKEIISLIYQSIYTIESVGYKYSP